MSQSLQKSGLTDTCITEQNQNQSTSASGLISVINDGFVEIEISEKHRRVQLLESPKEKLLQILFKSNSGSGRIIKSETDANHYTDVVLRDGNLIYSSRRGTTFVNMTGANTLTVGVWRNLSLHSSEGSLRVLLDGNRVGDVLDTAGVHDFLDPYLENIIIGGKGFEGCFRDFIQSLANESSGVLGMVRWVGPVEINCGAVGRGGIGAARAPDPLSIGVTLVIVFFVILLVAILASFIAFRIRRQHKEKASACTSGSLKHNGINSGLNPQGADPSATSGSFLHENGDVIRGVGGHHLGPELLAKKFKEPQRPDIIERETANKQRDDRGSLTNNDQHHCSVDAPEHYDLENASSIAPSDIDVVYHYKGFREAGGARKFKTGIAPTANFNHKHYAPRPAVRPPAAIARQHRSTPLARLSPSSELSSQQPRILTLHDISGKPLQSALLAATSSSGGVDKGSERSLDSVEPGPPVARPPPRSSSLVSTLDAVSSSSEVVPRSAPPSAPRRGSSSSSESGNDSFTCSEIEYDDEDKDPITKSRSDALGPPPAPPPYDAFDSSFRGSLSTLVASDDDLRGAIYRSNKPNQTNGQNSSSTLGWDYLLNWGPNFESLVGVFKDIAELPDTIGSRNGSVIVKPSEEYV